MPVVGAAVAEGGAPNNDGMAVVVAPAPGVFVLGGLPNNPPAAPVPAVVPVPSNPPVVPVVDVVFAPKRPPVAGFGGCPKRDVPVPGVLVPPGVVPNRDGVAGVGVDGLFPNSPPPVVVELVFAPKSPPPGVVAGGAPNRPPVAGLSALAVLSAGFGGCPQENVPTPPLVAPANQISQFNVLDVQ